MEYTLQNFKLAVHSGVISVVCHVSCLQMAREVNNQELHLTCF